MVRGFKEFIANLLDAMCAETYEPAHFYLEAIEEDLYVRPFSKE